MSTVIMDAAFAMDEPSFRPDIETVSGLPDSWPCSALEAALILGVSERTIRRAIARGELVATKRGGLYRIAQEALTLYQQRQVRAASEVGTSDEVATTAALTSPFIPRPLTSFVGRAFEMAAVMALLERGDVRLLTLTGPGGVGKTRFSGEIISRIQGAFRDGVWFVPLAGIRSPDLVLPSIALALGLRDTGEVSLERRLRDYLRLRQVLLVVDNFEHVLPASVQIGELLQACPNLTVLVTSRAPLRLQGEQEFPVPALVVPDHGARIELDRLAEIDAVALFSQRARAAQPDFALTADNVVAVLSICRRVDGLPLAIELAAARIGLFSPDSLLARMERRLPLLSGGTRDQPARLRTMYDAIAWSYDLLTAEEQALFRRLAVFVDGVSVEAAEAMAIAMGATPGNAIETFTSLLRQSVLKTSASPQDDTPSQPRLDMFETIREFALEQLSTSGEEHSARTTHADWFRALADDSASRWFTGQQQWANRWEADHGNLRAALEWISATEPPATLLRMTAAIWPFWFLRSHYAEGRMWLERALAGTVGERTQDRSHALNGIASVSVFRGDAPQVTAWCEESLAIAQEVGFGFGAGNALLILGHAAFSRGDLDRAQELQEAALREMRALGDDVPSAAPVASAILGNLADVAIAQGDAHRASKYADEALAMQRRLGFTWGAVQSLYSLATIARRDGNIAQAVSLFQESLRFAWEQRDQRLMLRAIDQLATCVAEQGGAISATRLFGAGARIRECWALPWTSCSLRSTTARSTPRRPRSATASQLPGPLAGSCRWPRWCARPVL